MNLRRVAALLISLPVLLALGCYSPSIAPGGFTCGSDGGCPDNFHCASNHRCYQEADASFDMPPVCTSVTKAPKVCETAHANGQICNPRCQTGCDGCGWCGVSNGATKCLTGTAGTSDVGAICDPSQTSECKVGLFCQPECGKGRCYRICESSDDSVCGSGSKCSVTGNSRGDAGTFSFALCSLVATGTCDAVIQTGCVDPVFACYPTFPTECDCPGSVANGQPCQLAAQCGRGSSCIGLSMQTQICLQTCKTNTDCTSGTCNNAAPYGYCL